MHLEDKHLQKYKNLKENKDIIVLLLLFTLMYWDIFFIIRKSHLKELDKIFSKNNEEVLRYLNNEKLDMMDKIFNEFEVISARDQIEDFMKRKGYKKFSPIIFIEIYKDFYGIN